jgi:diacylglycerol kinase (ATP)
MSRELCVIFNPAAGRNRAGGRLERLRRRWGDQVEFQPTQYAGHAVALARQAALDGFHTIAAAGGDGTVHEVANGILLAQNPEVEFAVLPIGSANDYAYSLEHGLPPRPASGIHRVDVGVVRTDGGPAKFFVCCLGLGFNGAVTLESRRVKRLQGIALYGLATLRALWYHYRTAPMEITIDDQPVERLPTLMLSVLAGRREGGFIMAPAAQLDDGWFEYAHAGALSRLEVLGFLPRLALAGPPSNHPKVRLGRCRHIHLRAETPLIVHVDGEFYCKPQDKIREIDIQLLPAALRVRTAI